MEHAVAFMAGSSFLVIGLSLLFRPGAWMEWLEAVKKQGKRAALTIGMCEILLGGLIVGFHWKWEGLPLVLTIIGAWAMLEGAFYLLFPGMLGVILRWMKPHWRWMMPVGGIITLVLAGAILCEWWQYMQAQECLWQPCYNQASNP